MTIHLYEQFGDYDQRIGRVNSYCVRKIKVVSDVAIDRDLVVGMMIGVVPTQTDIDFGRIAGAQFALNSAFPVSNAPPSVVIPTVQDYVVQPIRNNPLECFVAVIYRGALLSFSGGFSYPYTRSSSVPGRTFSVLTFASSIISGGGIAWSQASPTWIEKTRTDVTIPNLYVGLNLASIKNTRLNARNAIGKVWTLDNYGFPVSDKFIATRNTVTQIAPDQMYVEITYTGENDTPQIARAGYATIPAVPAWNLIVGKLSGAGMTPQYTLSVATDYFALGGTVP